MKKSIISLFFALIISISTFGQLTGTKTIPGDYASVADAITALNTSGVGSGGVTFNVAAGYTETFLSLNAGLITATGTASNPVIFKKSGSGANPVITSAPGTVATTEYIICLQGTDYITFDGIDVTDPSGTVEWGYALLKSSGTDGAQNVTIKNCNITMNKTNITTVGIYSANVTPSAPTSQLSVTAVTGANSNLKIFSNTLNNCYSCIALYGFNDLIAPYLFFDQNNEIGKDGANTITNVGGGSAIAYGIYAIYQNNLKVANNSVTSTMGGTNSHYGIFLTTSKNGSYDLYNNTVSMQYTGTGTTAFYPIYCEMGASSTSNVVNIYNNTVTGCTYSTMTTGNAYMMQLLNLGVTTNIYNNLVTNNTIGASGVTATGRINYLFSQKTNTTLGPISFHDNTVTGNSRIQSVSGGGATYFISTAGTGTLLDLYNNSVTNNLVASNGGTYCIYASFDIGTKNVYNNTISNISRAEGTVYGLYAYNVSANSGPQNFYRNTVQNIEGLTAGSNMYGIYLSSSTGLTTNFYNNMVSDLRTPAGLSGASVYNSINGIYINSGSPVGVYNNTVFLSGTSTAANFGTSAFYFYTSAKVELRNNILVNNTVPKGLGKTVAMRFSSVTLTNYVSTSNYNNFYAGVPGTSNLLFFDGTNSDQNLATFWVRVSPRDLQSVTELSPFVNIATSPYNVHLKNNVATQCEHGGSTISAPIAITDDFDNEARYPNPGYPVNPSFPPNAPDMGADEIGGIPNDITSPSIVYTPLANTYNGNPRLLTAAISDGSGVPTSGNGLPVLYWKINSGSYQAAQGTYVSGNNYSFTFGAGTSVGDVVSYYIAAQDLASAPNTGVYPWLGSSGFSISPPACSTPPSTPFTYTIMVAISGVFHIGIAKDYATLTAAANAINVKFISGPLTLILDDAVYLSETFPIIFNSNPGSSATNTLTIKPNTGISTTFVTTIAGGSGLLHFVGIDYVVIDGSNNGTTSNNLLIQNTSTVSGSYGIEFLNFGGTDPATNITIKNCKIQCTPVNSSIVMIVPIVFSSTGGGYDNCTISNNTIIGGFDGIQLFGNSTGIIHDAQITNNMIGSYLDTEAISRTGVSLQYADNTLISNNEIMGPYLGSLNTGQTGIYMGAGSTNTKIRKNKIHDFYHNSDDGWGATGIWFASDATTVTEISNNLIYDIKAPGMNPGVGQNITYGIFVRSGGNVKILHNTISLTGPFLSTQYDASSACLGFYYQATGGNFEVRNNILRNSMVPTTLPGSPWGKAYGIMISTLPAMFTVINNNDYYIDGYNGNIGQKYTNGVGIDADFPTLASWQTYTGQEANSLTVNPVFMSPTNLIPTTTAMPHAGSYLSNIPTDYTGVNRTNPPDMGAYEFTMNPLINTLAVSAVLNNSATLNGSANATGTTFNLFFDWGMTSAYGNTAIPTPASVTGSSLNPMSANLTGLTGLTTYHYRARGVTAGGLIVYGNDMTFTTAPNAPTVVTTAATSITSTGAILNGTVNANGGTATVTFDYGLTTAYGTTVNATPNTVTGIAVNPVSAVLTGLLPNATYHYRVNGVNVTGLTNGNDMTFTTVAIVPVVVTNFASGVGTTSATLNGTVTANNAATTVTFQYGLTTAYGSSISATPATANGMSATPVLASLTGLAINTTYHFRCVGVNVAGTTYGLDQQFTTNCVAPVITINGPATGCSGTAGYVYTTDPAMSGYTWNISAGGTITSGQGTNSVTVTWNTAGAQNVSVNYNNQYGCSASSAQVYNVTVNASPVPVITGSGTACVQFSTNYSTQSGMTGYTWTVSAGGTITSGQGTNAVAVTWNTSGAKTVTVNYANAAGCFAPSPTVFNVTVNSLPSPTITGQTIICANSGYITYTTETGMSNYAWTVSAGGTISAGQGTNVVSITWNTPGAQTVSVNYTNANGCTALAPTVLNVTVNGLPGAAGTITGTANVCGGAQGVTYSCAPIPNTSYYVWTLPTGATIASGSGTNSITVNFATNASSGNITVYGNNLCGNGTVSPNFPVTVTALPAAAGPITGSSAVCEGSSGIIYSVPSIPNASSYNWTVPTGAVIVSGGSTNTITVDFSMSAVSGDVTVYGTNSCGNGTVSPPFAVTVNPIPATPVVTVSGNLLSSSAATGNQWYFEGNLIPGATGQTCTATQSGWYWTIVQLNGCTSDTSNHVNVIMTGQQELQQGTINIYPVPSDGRFTVSITSPSTEPFTISVFSSLGVRIFQVKDIRTTGSLDQVIDLRPAASGFYSVVVQGNSFYIVRKIVVR